MPPDSRPPYLAVCQGVTLERSVGDCVVGRWLVGRYAGTLRPCLVRHLPKDRLRCDATELIARLATLRETVECLALDTSPPPHDLDVCLPLAVNEISRVTPGSDPNIRDGDVLLIYPPIAAALGDRCLGGQPLAVVPTIRRLMPVAWFLDCLHGFGTVHGHLRPQELAPAGERTALYGLVVPDAGVTSVAADDTLRLLRYGPPMAADPEIDRLALVSTFVALVSGKPVTSDELVNRLHQDGPGYLSQWLPKLKGTPLLAQLRAEKPTMNCTGLLAEMLVAAVC